MEHQLVPGEDRHRLHLLVTISQYLREHFDSAGRDGELVSANGPFADGINA